MKTFAGLVVSASLVAGHGYVNNATLDSESYTFYQPYTDPYENPIPSRVSRPIQGNGPVTVVTWDDIQCGGDLADGIDGSSPAKLTANVTAGSTVDLYWTLWPTSHVGPTITYMARCANDDCTTYMPGNDTVWFKVQEEGRNGTSDIWGSTAVMTAGGYVSYTVPECIESGAYLVRHEIIALHAAETEGGAQFYPGCHQVKVSGGGSTTPSDLVAFPGAYNATDPGILYNPYEATTYTIPGPALFSCSGSSSSSSSAASSSSGSSAVSSAAAVTGAASTSSFATVSSSASTASSVTPTTVAAAASVAPTTAAAAAASVTSADDDESCPDETSAASAAAATSAASGEDESCPDETVYLTITPAATSAQAAATGASSGDDGEDTCEEYTTSTVVDAQPTTIYETVTAGGAQATETAAASAASSGSSSSDSGSVATNPETSSSSSSSSSDPGSVTTNPETSSSSSSTSTGDDSGDEGCDADGEGEGEGASPTTTASSSSPTSTSTGDDSDDEGCDADGEGEGASPTTTSSSSPTTTSAGGDDDDCDAEPPSQPSETASSTGDGGDEDCNDEEELAYAQQYYKAAKIARGPRGMPLMFDH